MNSTTFLARGPSLAALAAALLLTGCVDGAPLGPNRGPASPSAPSAADAGGESAGMHGRTVELGSCGILQVPAGNALAFHVYAAGTQIYRWDGAGWAFVEPSAVLYADPRYAGVVGTHYAGPTWESNSGSKVVGAVLQRCTPDADAVPWLLLEAASTDGPGIFQRTTFVQRVNTSGGTAPAGAGSFTGELTSVPYTAEYVFYRAR